MALPNPLASRWGRLMAFFFLYVVASSLLLVQWMAYATALVAIGLTAGALLVTGSWPRSSASSCSISL